jgi:hypothetical protein
VLQQEDEEENNSDREEKVEYKDMAAWKRDHDIDPRAKVFIIKGGYNDLREALLERGWVENYDFGSRHFDLKWTCKQKDVFFEGLQ